MFFSGRKSGVIEEGLGGMQKTSVENYGPLDQIYLEKGVTTRWRSQRPRPPVTAVNHLSGRTASPSKFPGERTPNQDPENQPVDLHRRLVCKGTAAAKMAARKLPHTVQSTPPFIIPRPHSTPHKVPRHLTPALCHWDTTQPHTHWKLVFQRQS